MFTENATLMLYVENVQAEYDFWKTAGFEILSKETIMDYDTFENTTFVVKSWADYPDEYMTLYTKNRKAKRQHKRK